MPDEMTKADASALVQSLEWLYQANRARIDALEKVLQDLVTYHEGYRMGVGPCVCKAHVAARLLLKR